MNQFQASFDNTEALLLLASGNLTHLDTLSTRGSVRGQVSLNLANSVTIYNWPNKLVHFLKSFIFHISLGDS
jgi:hypothetical protein